MPTEPTTGKVRWRRARRVAVRGLRITGIVLLGLIVVCVVALSLPNVRRIGLERALEAANEALPGTIEARVAWPSLGRIEIAELRWQEGDTLLARARRVVVDVDLGAALAKHAVVRRAEVDVAWLDVDAIATSMPDTANTAPDSTSAAPPGPLEVPWLQPGSIEGLPSFAVESLSVQDLTAVTSGATVTVYDVSLRVDARPGRTEVARLDLDVATDDVGRVRGGVAVAVDDSLRLAFDVWDWTPPDTAVDARDVREGLQVVLPADIVERVLEGNLDVVPLSAHGLLFEEFPVDLSLAAAWQSDGALSTSLRLRVPRAPTWIEPFLADVDSTTGEWIDRFLRDQESSGQSWSADVDAGATVRASNVEDLRTDLQLDVPGWVRIALLGARWDGGTAASVDSIAVVAPGLDVHADGTFDGTDVDASVALDARLAVLAERLTARLGPGPWDDLPVVARLDLGVVGAWRDPRVDLQLDAGTEQAPRALRLRGTHDRRRVDFDLDVDVAGLRPLVPDSLAAPLDASTLRELRLRIDGSYDVGDTSAVVDLDLDMTGDEIRAAIAGRFAGAASQTLTANVDTLRAAYGELDLATTGPVEIAVDPADSTVRIAGLVMEGTAGRIAIDGGLDDGRARGAVRVDLDVADLRTLLPDSLSAPLEASTLRTIDLVLDADYDFRRRAGEGTIRLDTVVDEGEAHLEAVLSADLPRRASVRVDTLRAQWRELDVASATPLVLDADLDAMNLVLDGLDLRSRFGSLTGRARADSTSADGQIEVDLAVDRAQLVAWRPELDRSLPAADSLRVQLDLVLGGTALAPRAEVDGAVVLTNIDGEDLELDVAMDYGNAERASLVVGVTSGTTSWLSLEARVPVDVALDPPTARLRPEDTFDLQLKTPVLDLAEVASRTRAPVELDGDLRIELSGRGPLGSLDLSGAIESDRARAELDDGSWMETSTSIRLSGNSKAPRVDGAVTVQRGLIVLPEVPPSRLPTDGKALLWEVARADTARTVERAVSPLDTLTLPLPDVAMRLNVPRGLRLRGHGLDVELRGDVEVTVADGVPGISGGLEVWRGRLDLLGRRFEVDTGTVTFDPDQVEPDPELDIRLSTTIDATEYRVTVTGKASAPRLALSSEPEMPEGDIVSALLFGRPLDELDEGQSNLLAQRTQQIAAAYGAAMLSQRIGQRLGVDILSIEPSSDGGAASLVVGQYLSPDVVVQYEQVLEEGAAALVRLEYAITRTLRLETTASQGEHSGVEIEWRKDY